MPLPCAARSVAAADSSRTATVTARMITSSNVIFRDDRARWSRIRRRRRRSRQFGFDGAYFGLAPRAARGADWHDVEKPRWPRRQQEQAVTKADRIVDVVGHQQRRHRAAVYQGGDLIAQPR